MDKTIFGLRFKSNEAIQPTAEDLRLFLESPKKEGGREKHGDDTAKYLQHLSRVEEFAKNRGLAQADIREKMLYGVLAHSHFFKPSLKSAVEQYQYHCHKLATMDFRKPQTFIRSAEEEMKKLNTKKKEDQPRIARFQDMIDRRNKDIEAMKAGWAAIVKELYDIAVYIKENLLEIQKRCESSITVLVSLQVEGEKEGELREDIKRHFKDHVRDLLQLGPVTKQYVETLKEDVSNLSRQLSKQVLEDIYSVTKVCEEVYDHTKKIAARLDPLVSRFTPGQRKDIEEDRTLFKQIEQVLVSLVSDYHFEASVGEGPKTGADHDRILNEKRTEMLNHVLELLAK